MDFNKIGIIGSGTMGTCVAADLLLHNLQCVLVDVSVQAIEQSKTEIMNIIRFGHMMDSSLAKMSWNDVEDRITFTTNMKDIRDVEFVIENVNEDWSVKKAVYQELSSVCKSDVIFAANTSCVSITKIAGETDRPDKVIGIHFMNPSYLKKYVETIRGYHTSQICIENTNDFLSKINKEMILVNDLPGFVTNRISHLFMNEAVFVVQDGVAEPEQVDDIFKKCYGHKMGPLETADLIGLDTVVKSLDILYESYQDSKYRCCPLLRKMVHANLLGRKTKEGFYRY